MKMVGPWGKSRGVFGGIRNDTASGTEGKSLSCNNHSARYRMMWFAWVLLVGMLLQTLVQGVAAEDLTKETEDPAHARPSCRIFVDATSKHSRFLLLLGYEDDAEVVVLDQFPVISPGLGDAKPTEAYHKLRPGFMSIAAHLHQQSKPIAVQPRYCHTHLLVSGDLQHHVGNEKLDSLLREIHQGSIEDADFPFLFAREDLRVIDSRAKAYYQMLGVNFLDGRIAPSLAPGAVELSGVLSLHDESLMIGFDVQERWRRGIRRKQLSRSLNTTDFYLFEHVDFAQDRLHLAIARTLFQQYQKSIDADDKKPVDSPALAHPCFPPGFKENLPVVGASSAGVQFLGTGNAKDCVANITAFVKATNQDCPQGSFCLLNSVSQPKPASPFFASGKFMMVAKFTNEVLKRLHEEEAKKGAESTDTPIILLDLPLPSLAALRVAASHLCGTSVSILEGWNLQYDVNKSPSNACFDLSQVLVLLQQLGVEEREKRVVFGEPLAPKSTPSSSPEETASQKILTRETPSEVSWFVGVFLVLQLIEKRQTFSIEADEFAVRVGEGLPMGINMSILLLGSAVVFLYLTTGSRVVKSKSAGYRRQSTGGGNSLNGGRSQESERRTTSAIIFVDDASE